MKINKLNLLAIVISVLVVIALLIPEIGKIKSYFRLNHVAKLMEKEMRLDPKFANVEIKSVDGHIFITGKVRNDEDCTQLRKMIDSKKSRYSVCTLFKVETIEENR